MNVLSRLSKVEAATTLARTFYMLDSFCGHNSSHICISSSDSYPMQSTNAPRRTNPYAQQDDSQTSFDSTAKDSTANLTAQDGMSQFYSEVRPLCSSNNPHRSHPPHVPIVRRPNAFHPSDGSPLRTFYYCLSNSRSHPFKTL